MQCYLQKSAVKTDGELFPKICTSKLSESTTNITNADRDINGMYYMAYGNDMCLGSKWSGIRRIVQ